MREDERDWEGAAEAMLRNFVLSLMVPDQCYADVSIWVDKTFSGWIVYYPVDAGCWRAADVCIGICWHATFRQVPIRRSDWLEREVANRFNDGGRQAQEQFPARRMR